MLGDMHFGCRFLSLYRNKSIFHLPNQTSTAMVTLYCRCIINQRSSMHSAHLSIIWRERARKRGGERNKQRNRVGTNKPRTRERERGENTTIYWFQLINKKRCILWHHKCFFCYHSPYFTINSADSIHFVCRYISVKPCEVIPHSDFSMRIKYAASMRYNKANI